MDQNWLLQSSFHGLDSSSQGAVHNPASDQNLRDGWNFGLSQQKDFAYANRSELSALWKSGYSLGAFALYRSVLSYTPTDEFDNALGSSVQPFALDLGLRASRPISKQWSAGLGLHLPMEQVAFQAGDQLALGLGMDLGLVYNPSDKRQVSLLVRNLGMGLRSYQNSGENYRLMDTRFSAQTLWRSLSEPRWNFEIGAEGGFYTESHLLFGTEYRFSPWFQTGVKAPLFQSDLSRILHYALDRSELITEQDALLVHEVKLSWKAWNFNLKTEWNRKSPVTLAFALNYRLQKEKEIVIPDSLLKVKTMPGPIVEPSPELKSTPQANLEASDSSASKTNVGQSEETIE